MRELQQQLAAARDELARLQLTQDQITQTLAELAEANRERLRDMFDALYQGASLPAQGIAQACEYCEMRGLCRRDYWNA